MFKENIRARERVYRSVAGTILISTYFNADGFAWNGVSLFVGLYLLFTAVVSTCPIYSVLGRTSLEADAPDAEESA